LNFKEGVRLAALKKHCSKSHFEMVKKDNGAAKYCMKEDTRVDGPWEYGEKPVERNSKTDWEEVKANAISGNFEAIPADILIKHYQNLKRIRVDHITTKDVEECRGIWIWGAPGTGKTHHARTQYGEDIYIKP